MENHVIPNHIIQCKTTSLYLADMGLLSISITNFRDFAIRLSDEQAAAIVIERLKRDYGSFDWQDVPLKG